MNCFRPHSSTRKLAWGLATTSEVSRWFNALLEAPLTWPEWPDAPTLGSPVRRALLRRFPFAIAYQALEDRIMVIAIAHTSRRPFYWAKRTEYESGGGAG